MLTDMHSAIRKKIALIDIYWPLFNVYRDQTMDVSKVRHLSIESMVEKKEVIAAGVDFLSVALRPLSLRWKKVVLILWKMFRSLKFNLSNGVTLLLLSVVVFIETGRSH